MAFQEKEQDLPSQQDHDYSSSKEMIKNRNNQLACTTANATVM